MKDNITLSLTFENYQHPKDGTFLVVAGTVIERILDDQGKEVLNEKGKVVHRRIDFMQPADHMATNLSQMVDDVVTYAIKNYEDANNKTEERGQPKQKTKEGKGNFKKENTQKAKAWPTF